MPVCERCLGKGVIPSYFGDRQGGQICGACKGKKELEQSTELAVMPLVSEIVEYRLQKNPSSSLSEAISNIDFSLVESTIHDSDFARPPLSNSEIFHGFVFVFSGEVSFPQVRRAMASEGLRPADIWELLTYAYLVQSGNLNLVALGSYRIRKKKNSHFYPYLCRVYNAQMLLTLWGTDAACWDGSYRFLATKD